MQRGGIRRWVPNPPPKPLDFPPPPKLPEPPVDEPAPPARPTRTWKPHDLIACPFCHARMDERCLTPDGESRADHKTRLVKRVCSCGNRLPKPFARRCHDCTLSPERSH